MPVKAIKEDIEVIVSNNSENEKRKTIMKYIVFVIAIMLISVSAQAATNVGLVSFTLGRS